MNAWKIIILGKKLFCMVLGQQNSEMFEWIVVLSIFRKFSMPQNVKNQSINKLVVGL